MRTNVAFETLKLIEGDLARDFPLSRLPLVRRFDIDARRVGRWYGDRLRRCGDVVGIEHRHCGIGPKGLLFRRLLHRRRCGFRVLNGRRRRLRRRLRRRHDRLLRLRRGRRRATGEQTPLFALQRFPGFDEAILLLAEFGFALRAAGFPFAHLLLQFRLGALERLPLGEQLLALPGGGVEPFVLLFEEPGEVLRVDAQSAREFGDIGFIATDGGVAGERFAE